MSEFPELVHADVRVVTFTENHLTARYVSWLNDREVVQFSEQRHYIHTLASCRHYYESVKNTPNLFLAIEVAGHDHIGNMGVAMDTINNIADVSIIIGEKKAWGRGFASIAWSLVLNELLVNQAIRKVTAGTMGTNSPMIRLMERSGMQVESRRYRHFLWEGQEVDLVQAARFNNDVL